MEQVLDLVKELSEELKTLGVEDYKKKISELEEDVAYCDRQIKTGLEHIDKFYKRKREHAIQISAYEKENREERDYSSEIKAILSHPTVEGMEVVMEGHKYIYVYTDYIDIYDEKGNRFKGNKYKICFDFERMSVRIFGKDPEYSRRSCWGDGCPHPHVSTEGNPCLGDAGSMLAISMNEYELYASYIIVLNFLQQVNVDDGAGEYIYNWDCIDEDGNIIENPYNEKYDICCICDDRVHEDDIYICGECGDHMCGDHAYYSSDIREYICEDCRDNKYFTCDHCYEIYKDDNAIEIDGHYYCPECAESLGFTKCDECGEYFNKTTEVNGDFYCEHCLEENTFICSNCGNNTHDDDESVCTKCGDSFCSDCFNMDREMCDNCVDESEEE